MNRRKVWILLIGFCSFALIYWGIDLLMGFWFNEPIENWKSLSIAAISAVGLMYEGYKLNPDFQPGDIWSKQQRWVHTSFSANNFQELQAALSRKGYKHFNRNENHLTFTYDKNWRQGILQCTLELSEHKALLTVKPQRGLHLINMGYSSTHIHQIEGVMHELSSLLAKPLR
jgi:hypothetical protein